MDPILYEDNLPSKKQRIRDIQDKETGDLFAQPAPAVNSPTSQESAEQVSIETRAQRMVQAHNVITAAGAKGLARFEIAAQMGIRQEHYLSSTFNRLIKLGEIVELKRTHYNPESKRECAVLIDKRFLSLQPKDAA